jgi:hypothetical protein
MTSQVQDLGLANATAAQVAYASVPKYIQWGVGSAVAVSGTDLGSKTGTTEDRTSGTASQQTTTTTDDTFQVTGTITALAALAITEVGLFDAAGTGTPPSGGNMAFYADFSAINVAISDTITFTCKIVYNQA